MAIYHLNHRSVGKQTHAPGTAAAAVRYITRAAACERIDAVGGVSIHPKALEREALRQEEASRKNARICDKFVISLPREMTIAERIEVTRSFLIRLSQNGRARAFACYHGQDTVNPHVHVMFFDRDSETGKRVQRMSEPGSTERVRRMWQEVCNNHLERGGHQDRIDHRSHARIELEQAALEPDIAVEAAEQEDARTVEQDYSFDGPVIDTSDAPFDDRDPLEKIEHVLHYDEEFRDIQRTLDKFEALSGRRPREQQDLEHVSQMNVLRAGEAADTIKRYTETLAEYRDNHLDRLGHLKGYELTVAGVTVFRSRARENALRMRDQLEQAEEAMVSAKMSAQYFKNQREAALRRLRETNHQLQPIERMMQLYGSQEDARAIAADFKRSRDFGLDHLHEADIELASRADEIDENTRERLYGLKLEREVSQQQENSGEGYSH